MRPALPAAGGQPLPPARWLAGYRLAAWLIVLVVLGGQPASATARPDDTIGTAADTTRIDPAAADEDDHSDEVAIGLLAVVGVALLGLVMLGVAILGGNRVRRLARHSGRRSEPATDMDEATGAVSEQVAMTEDEPPRPRQNGSPSQSDHS